MTEDQERQHKIVINELEIMARKCQKQDVSFGVFLAASMTDIMVMFFDEMSEHAPVAEVMDSFGLLVNKALEESAVNAGGANCEVKTVRMSKGPETIQ